MGDSLRFNHILYYDKSVFPRWNAEIKKKET